MGIASVPSVPFFVVNITLNSTSCGLYCRAVCNIKNVYEPKNPRIIFKSGFKSRVGYNSAGTVHNTYADTGW